ncbi:MAG: PHP domain-containing protein, partial [Quisquiliibacterium sp.]
MISAYAELHCASNFTFLHGASHAEELIERAQALGYAALAITDECSLAGAVRAHLAARDAGLALLIGAQFSLHELCAPPLQHTRLVLLAQDREGYGNLSELITRARMRATKGSYRLEPADFANGIPGCLALLVPPASLATGPNPNQDIDRHQHPDRQAPQPADPASAPPPPHAAFTELACAWRERFPQRCWIAVELHANGGDAALLERLRAVSQTSGLPLVAAGDVLFHVRSRKSLHDTLSAIRLGRPVQALGEAIAPNAEQHLRSRLRLARLYPAALLEETLEVAARCNFSLDSLRYEYPREIVPEGHTPASWLRELTFAGVPGRYPQGLPEAVARQIEHELALIAELGYEAYFLTVADIVAFARGRGILCQGRGSAANSAVCYCLGITEVDPARMSVLFERFISRERNEPPDIDVDFE